MTTRRVDLLRGRPVRDPAGRVVGRIVDLVAEVAHPGSGEYLVREFHLGRRGFLARPRMIVIGWRDLDLSDPERPRLRRSISEAAMAPAVER